MNEQKLIALAEELEEQARGIRTTIALWQARSGARAINGFSATLNGAIKLRGKRGPYKKGVGDDGNGHAPHQKRTRRSTEEVKRDLTAAMKNGPVTAAMLVNALGYSSVSGMYGLLTRCRKQKLIKKGPIGEDGTQTYMLA